MASASSPDADVADGGRAETTCTVTSERDGSADATRRAGAGAADREIPRVVNTREVDNAEATDELVIARVSEEGEDRERSDQMSDFRVRDRPRAMFCDSSATL